MKKILLVKKIDIDPMENSISEALTYRDVGFIYPESINDYPEFNEVVHGSGWPIPKGETMPKYILVEVNEIMRAMRVGDKE